MEEVTKNKTKQNTPHICTAVYSWDSSFKFKTIKALLTNPESESLLLKSAPPLGDSINCVIPAKQFLKVDLSFTQSPAVR